MAKKKENKKDESKLDDAKEILYRLELLFDRVFNFRKYNLQYWDNNIDWYSDLRGLQRKVNSVFTEGTSPYFEYMKDPVCPNEGPVPNDLKNGIVHLYVYTMMKIRGEDEEWIYLTQIEREKQYELNYLEQIKKLETKIHENNLTIDAIRKEITGWLNKYKRIGYRLVRVDHNTLKKIDYEYPELFLKYYEHIDDYFNGWDGNDMVLYFSDEEVEITMSEYVYEKMKENIDLDEAKRLYNQLQNEKTYHTKSKTKIMQKKFMEMFIKDKPHTKDLFNLELVVNALIENAGYWVSITDELSKCDFDLSDKNTTTNKMAHNKLKVLIDANYVEKSEDGREARISPKILEIIK